MTHPPTTAAMASPTTGIRPDDRVEADAELGPRHPDELVERVGHPPDPPLGGARIARRGWPRRPRLRSTRCIRRVYGRAAAIPGRHGRMSMSNSCRTPSGRERARAYVVSSTNTDRRHNETFDRRRVDPPAGCRAAAEPAILAGRWSERCRQLKNNRTSPLTARMFGDVERSSGFLDGRQIHDGNWQVQLADYGHGPDRTRPHHPGRQEPGHRRADASPSAGSRRPTATAPGEPVDRDRIRSPQPRRTTGALSR